jgi:hypothetical protein
MVNSVSSLQYLKETPLPDDWNRFDIAASRIRRLIHDSREERRHYPAVDLGIFHCLKVHEKRFYHLRELDWVELNADIFPYVELFFGLHLVKLSLGCPKELTPAVVDLFSSIKNLSPNISTLTLVAGGLLPYYCRRLPIPVAGLSSLACSFTQLTSINVNFPVTAEAIKHLSLLPNFLELFINNDAAEIVKVITGAGLQRVFVNLTRLRLTAASPASCVEFLKLIRPVHLYFLSVRLGPSAAHDVHQMFVGVHAFCSHSQLVAFQVVNFDGEPLTPDTLEPLLSFRNLCGMTVRTAFSDFENVSLKRLAIAWPNLTRLTLHTRPDGDDRSKVCLEGLAELVTRCPHLEMLSIELHISTSNLENFEKNHGDLCNSTLSSLALLRSTFHCDAGELARSLRILFPDMRHFYADGQEPGYDWNDVARHLGFSRAHL